MIRSILRRINSSKLPQRESEPPASPDLDFTELQSIDKSRDLIIGIGLYSHEINLIKGLHKNKQVVFLDYLFSKVDPEHLSDELSLHITQHLQEVPIIIYLWGYRDKLSLNNLLKTHGNLKISRCEDGFIRSNGVHQVSQQGYSMIVDNENIYFDCSKPTRLEELIKNTHITELEKHRVSKVIETIKNKNITKYSISNNHADSGKVINNNTCVVFGQLEIDQSIIYGSPKIKTNLDLVLQVKKDFPDHKIYYRAHPEVYHRTTLQSSHIDSVRDHVDRIIDNKDYLISDIMKSDATICVLTSGAGFEALLHGKNVNCYGLPFYSGWGLTQDFITCDRRNISRSIEELFYAAYMQYSYYFSLTNFNVVDIEKILDEQATQ